MRRRGPESRMAASRDAVSVWRRVQGRAPAPLRDRSRADPIPRPELPTRRRQRRGVLRLLAPRDAASVERVERRRRARGRARVRRGGPRDRDRRRPGDEALGRRVLPAARGGQRHRPGQVRHPPRRGRVVFKNRRGDGEIQAGVQQARLRLRGVRRRLGTAAVQRHDAHEVRYRPRGCRRGEKRGGDDGSRGQSRPPQAPSVPRLARTLGTRRVGGGWGRSRARGDVEQREGRGGDAAAAVVGGGRVRGSNLRR
mmetsp:Transcript_2342/g.10350  ORF Transcript_2342/g.10350 Transcript_2342/m.10350 type:complete len:254 (+) Transcript_2342:86-847(+)